MNPIVTERILIRKATDRDLPAILTLWRELMEFHSNFDSRFQLTASPMRAAISHLRSELGKPTSFLAVAEHPSGLVGYCLASVHNHPSFLENRAYGFVSEFHVAHSFRRQGIGRSLFDEMKQWFRQKDVTRIELVTMNGNENSKAFWESMGCSAFAERRFVELG